MAEVTFLGQAEPVDEYGRALYAVARSILRAHFDELTQADLEDLNCDRVDVTFRQLAQLVSDLLPCRASRRLTHGHISD